MIWSGTLIFLQNSNRKTQNHVQVWIRKSRSNHLSWFEIKANADFSVDVDQANYVNGINPIMLTNDRMKYTFSPLTDKEKSVSPAHRTTELNN